MIVLGTTEDKDNYYHGNVIYLVDTKSWDQVGAAGPEFTPDLKAEGIVVWESYIGIIYDNDQRAISKSAIQGRIVRPSILQIFTSILPRR